MQLDLFHGEHLPLLRCHTALDRGDLGAARAALREASEREAGASLAARLDALEARLRLARSAPAGADPLQAAEAVHEAFEAALAPGAVCAGGLGPRDWFRLYAAHLAAALSPEPERRFRGWCAPHFELAAGRLDAAWRTAQRLAAAGSAGWTWLEAARVAHAAGAAAETRRLVLIACLVAEGALSADPPALEPVIESVLCEPAPLLPRLPADLESLWSEAEALDLPAPASTWVPAVGALAGVFPPVLLRSAEVAAASGFDAVRSGPPQQPPGHAALRALLAAREARAREGAFRGGACGDAELRARRALGRVAPPLLARYLAGLQGELAPQA
jgi:hypothetical protein